MSDPIDRLSQLGSSLDGGAMPKSAAEIRSRGDRIRRRRHALIAGAAATAVVAVAVPVVAVVGGPGGTTPPPAATDPATVSPLGPIGPANLMVADDIPRPDGLGVDHGPVRPGDGQAVTSPCHQSKLTGLGATAVLQRDYSFSALEGGDGDADHYLNETIAQFPTPADARAAADEIEIWFDECTEDDVQAEVLESAPWRPVEVPGADAQMWQGHYGPADAVPGSQYDTTDRDDLMWHLETGTVVAGDRLAMVTDLDLDAEVAAEPWVMEGILPAAAQRLLVENPETEQTGQAEEGESGSGFIPDGFPLAAGWPDDSEVEPGEEGLEGPSPDLPSLVFTACDETFVGPDYVDRLRANWSNVEDYRARQLSVYADVDAATEAADGLAEFFQSCPTGPVRDDGYRTDYEVLPLDVADGAWAILQRDTLDGGDSPFGQTTVVVRDATSVLVLDSGGHAGYPTGDGQQTVQGMLDEAAEVIAALPSIQENLDDGATDPDATEGPGLEDPAVTTEVPADFPLDIAYDPELYPSAQTVGPDPLENGVFSTNICDEDAAVLSRLDGSRLGFGVTYEGESYHGRAIRAYPTVQAAIDEVERLEAQLTSCERDVPWESDAERVWHTYPSATGWNDLTFGYTYEGQAAGVLYTVLRVGNAVLTISTGAEYSPRDLREAIPGRADLVEAIAPEMCIFTADGC